MMSLDQSDAETLAQLRSQLAQLQEQEQAMRKSLESLQKSAELAPSSTAIAPPTIPVPVPPPAGPVVAAGAPTAAEGVTSAAAAATAAATTTTALPEPPTSVPEAALEQLRESVAGAAIVPPELADALPSAADAVAKTSNEPNLLAVGAGVLVGIPVAAFGVAAFVKMINGGDEEPTPFNEASRRALAEMDAARASGDATQGGNTGLSADEIFTRGLSNLAEEPFGWLFGKESALYSNLPAASPGAPRMGAKELARQQARAAGAAGFAPPAGVAPAGVASPKFPAFEQPIPAAPPPPVFSSSETEPLRGVVEPTFAVPSDLPPSPTTPPPVPSTMPMPTVASAAKAAVSPAAAPAAAAVLESPTKVAPDAPTEVPIDAGSAEARLAEVQSLLDNGFLSQAEFEVKRREIMGDLAVPALAEGQVGTPLSEGDASRLREAEMLLGEGLITTEEFEAKRREIVGA
jgi:hypothetical protein